MNGCYGCTQRCVGCHANCNKYKEFKTELERIKKNEKTESFKRRIMFDDIYFNKKHPLRW